MPDGTTLRPGRDPADEQALSEDGQLLSGVRLRLVLWSGGSTLLVLVILAAALYLVVAQALAAAGGEQVGKRADEIDRALHDSRGGPGPSYGFLFGGDSSGTYAVLVRRDGHPVDPRADLIDGIPDEDALAAAADLDGKDDVRMATIANVPWRVLTREIETTTVPVYLQVLQDRRTEVQTLNALLQVLLVGGAVVVLVGFGFGAIYARRALVPIRDSLVSQRAALRRQREFAADASHELRTPLTVIRSSVEHLRRNRDRPIAEVADAVEDIDAEVGHLTSLVDDLLLLARSDSGALSLARQPVDIGDVAAEAAGALAKSAATKGVALVVDPEPAIVAGDSVRLRRLVLILVDNAVRHTPAGGGVRVRVRRQAGEGVLEVDDDGPGVKPDDMPRIFERFWRAPGGKGGGAGLGLAIAKSIVDLHGGRIAVANREAGGARFSVRLPALPDEPAARPETPPTVPADRPA